MELSVLGELVVREGGVPVSPPEAPARQLLALLAAFADRIVPTCALVEELWPEGEPPHSEHAVEFHVRQVRTAVGAALERAGRARTAEEVLVRVPGGYRLDTGGGFCDARAFERMAGAGYRAMKAGDLDTAGRRLREALDLWTSVPFRGVAQGPHLREQADLLSVSWQRAVDRWIDAEVRRGRWRELCVDLARVLTRFRPPTLLYAQLKADLDRHGQDRRVIEAYLRRRRGPSAVLSHRVPGQAGRVHRARVATAPALTAMSAHHRDLMDGRAV